MADFTAGDKLTAANLNEVIAKAWVRFSMSDDTIDDSFNITSLTNVGTGETTITFDTDFSSVNYVAVWGNASRNGADDYHNILTAPGSEAAGSIQPVVYRVSTGLRTNGLVSGAFFGDQA